MTEEFISSKLYKLKICTSINKIKPLSGGCISKAMCYSTDTGDYFVKTNTDEKAPQWFRAESLALNRMNQAVPGFVPRPIHYNTDEPSFIVTEYVSMSNQEKSLPSVQRQLGKLLGQLHLKSSEEKFGFDVTSFCGTTELNNAWNSNWSDFFRYQRIEPLLNQVKGQNQDIDRLGKEINLRMDHWLGDLDIKPCLLHGDLWNGNWAIRQEDNTPVIFDPASYYGHNEAEFGIMKMFGGFTNDCFEAYDDTVVVTHDQEGRKERVILYEMYHHLNHYAMFGEGYDTSCVHLMERLI